MLNRSSRWVSFLFGSCRGQPPQRPPYVLAILAVVDRDFLVQMGAILARHLAGKGGADEISRPMPRYWLVIRDLEREGPLRHVPRKQIALLCDFLDTPLTLLTDQIVDARHLDRLSQNFATDFLSTNPFDLCGHSVLAMRLRPVMQLSHGWNAI